MSKLSIIIPVFNENGTLYELLEKVYKVELPYNFEKEIIVVDDGSTDGTSEKIKNLDERFVKVLKEKNGGKGTAIREGMKYVTGDYLVIQDADLEYEPNDLSNLLKIMVDNKLEVIYGSRLRDRPDVKTSGFKFFLGGYLLTLITNFLYWQKLTDEPTCYKMFKTDLIKSFPLVCQRFEFCPEVTAYTAKRGIKIKEIPIAYYPRSVEEGKKIRAKDFLEAVWTLFRLRVWSPKTKSGIDVPLEQIAENRKHSFGEDERSLLDKIIFYARFHKIIPSIPKDTDLVIDFGSGFKADSLQYLIEKKLARRGIGLDLSVCKTEKFESIELKEMDFEKDTPPINQNSGDVVLSLAILEHMYNPKKYMEDMFNSLKPGGVLLLTTPSPYSKPILEFLAHKLKLIDAKEIDDHKHYFSLKELEALAEKVGFKEFKASYFELGVNNFLWAKK